MAYEFFYEGISSPYSLNKDYGELFSGYRMPSAEIGLTTDPRIGNQLAEMSTKLSVGTKLIEIEGLSPQVLDAIPKQQMTEMNRLAKLTGVETSMHGPLVEPSGYSKEGWSESGRIQAENEMYNAVSRAHDLNPEGNVPVTFHSNAMLPEAEEKIKEDDMIRSKSIIMVDPRTGQIQQIKEEPKYFPEQGIHPEIKKQIFEPQKEIDRKNKEMWLQNLNNVNYYAMVGQREIDEIFKGAKDDKNLLDRYSKYSKNTEEFEKLPETEKELIAPVLRQVDHASIFLRDSYNAMRNLYNNVYKDANEKDKKKLDAYKEYLIPFVKEGIEEDPAKIREFAKMVQQGVHVLKGIEQPKLFMPLNDFLVEKSGETIGNVAWKSYDEFKDKAPIISIENPPIGTALSRADELKKLIEQSRKSFVDKAVDKGMSKSQAEDTAKKLIGATWDVGHINMLRKYGYEKEEIIKETETIAPFVKHVHLSDNFGMEHTELPMGMGNVPIKEIMEKLGKEGFEGRKIVEAGDWWQHFKTPPTAYTLEAFGSPIYGAMMAPYWNQMSGTYGTYFSGYGKVLPEQHFSIYGTGISNLPTELGGQIPGRQSRMSGTPMD